METQAPITQQDMNAILDFFKQHNIAWIGAEGDKNGVTFAEYFDLWSTKSGLNMKFTPQALEVAFSKLQDSLYFYTPDETEYRLYEEQGYSAQLETIKKFLPSYRLSADGESLYVNTNIIMEYAISTNRVHQISKEDLRRMLGNLISRPGVKSLHWSKPPKQQWEIERDRKAEEAEKLRLDYLEKNLHNSPDGLRQRQEQEIAKAKADYQEMWKQRVVDYIASIQRNNSRAMAQELYGKSYQDKDWEKAFRDLDISAQRQKYSTNATRWAR